MPHDVAFGLFVGEAVLGSSAMDWAADGEVQWVPQSADFLGAAECGLFGAAECGLFGGRAGLKEAPEGRVRPMDG